MGLSFRLNHFARQKFQHTAEMSTGMLCGRTFVEVILLMTTLLAITSIILHGF